MSSKVITVALAGNPNSGKSTIFNNLTGTRQKVGNWPGVTVEKKEGHLTADGYHLTIVDLPGTYSLTAYSLEEIVARNFILDEKPDVVVDILDCSNLERNLYLATQLSELDTKVIFVLNMADIAEERGIEIDGDKLSELLDVPVVFTVGNKGKGTHELIKAIISATESHTELPRTRRVYYGREIEKAISELTEFIKANNSKKLPYNIRWIAIKLLEDDRIVKEQVRKTADSQGEAILKQAYLKRKNLRDFFNEDPEILMTDHRYGFIAGIIKEVIRRNSKSHVDVSRQIDLVLTNRLLGLPIFVFFIWAMFQLTFSLGSYPVGWIDAGMGWLGQTASEIIPDGPLADLIVDGVIAGVGSVAIFMPNILILFFCIAVFEDTGYMARAAFLMDKVMHLIGLHGKSFIPLLMGFGCNVPAIMATRTLESEKDRILTILIIPLMSCSARLPVYILLAGTFFGASAGNVIFSIYALGIVLAVTMGRLFRSTILRGKTAPFVMELPPYRTPMLKGLLIHMWDRSKVFLRKMGGIILIGSVTVWFLSTFPRQVQLSKDYDSEIAALTAEYSSRISAARGDLRQKLIAERDRIASAFEGEKAREKVEKSYIGRLGKALSPVFAPIGIDWRGSVALLSGFVAKEIVVSTMGVLYAGEAEADEESNALKGALKKSGMTHLSAYAMMTFVLIYVPCIATVAAIKHETNSWKWALFSITYSTALAWLVAFVIYQGGKAFGLA
ncbi:MAG: ferrous iron transport protein B [Deltaproteobacteria bacterium]|nr:ferrous iron transport protein B [Deltaproteobacteria bacterium]RLB91054.1 MAG: ferrous iron transport protein B [Deltaproteobacteria bacterium]RLB94961.1 MAG: ferrous iron transport protein B [Deltaproteobacteria bacterium]